MDIFDSISACFSKVFTSSNKSDYCRSEYYYYHDALIKSPFLKKMPREHAPKPVWTLQALKLEIGPGFDSFQKALYHTRSHDTVTHPRAKSGIVDSVYDYVDLLEDNPNDVFSCKVVQESKIAITDEDFAEYRLSGPNASTIRLANEEDLKGLSCEQDERLAKLLKEKKLFIVDYSILASVKDGKVEIKGFPKYIMGSVALFEEVGHSLLPVCIKIIDHIEEGASAKSVRTLVLNRPTQRNEIEDPDYKWEIAKTIFQSNDFSYHEFFSHLSGTHLIEEIYLIATYRRFPEDHPLFKLLAPHFEGTAFINDSAFKDLANDGGVLDLYFPGKMDHLRKLAAIYIEAATKSDLRFPERVKARQMDSENVPNLRYPYRDDGMLVWNAIYKWVTEFINIFYRSDEEIAADRAIYCWIQDLVDKKEGNVQWLASFQYTREWLSDVIAAVIFTGSAEHAAVNFPQRTHQQFTPVFPAAIYGSMDVLFKDDVTERDYLSMFPPPKAAKKLSEVTKLLGGVHYTKLGQYDEHTLEVGHYFKGIVSPVQYHQEVHEALKRFHDELEKVAKEIHLRNTERHHKYEVLLPELIPQSTNI